MKTSKNASTVNFRVSKPGKPRSHRIHVTLSYCYSWRNVGIIC